MSGWKLAGIVLGSIFAGLVVIAGIVIILGVVLNDSGGPNQQQTVDKSVTYLRRTLDAFGPHTTLWNMGNYVGDPHLVFLEHCGGGNTGKKLRPKPGEPAFTSIHYMVAERDRDQIKAQNEVDEAVHTWRSWGWKPWGHQSARDASYASNGDYGYFLEIGYDKNTDIVGISAISMCTSGSSTTSSKLRSTANAPSTIRH